MRSDLERPNNRAAPLLFMAKLAILANIQGYCFSEDPRCVVARNMILFTDIKMFSRRRSSILAIARAYFIIRLNKQG